MADSDYDIWIGNVRGTTYSRNHTTLNAFGTRKNRQQYWDFSFHEIGLYDLSASIDYVLAQTGQSKLQYIGVSQGVATFFVMMSERPEYNNKIEMMHAMAPAVFVSHVTSSLIHKVASFINIMKVSVF